MRPLTISLFLSLVAGLWGHAATLEKLSLEQMINKSTAVVRGRVTGSSALRRGPVIYTVSRIQVLETWKGPEAATVDVAVPGGAYGGLRQHFSGAPSLEAGQEYVLFLWTGKSGVTQVIGLSQGVFAVRVNQQGQAVAERAAIGELMLSAGTGQPVADAGISIALDGLRRQVRNAASTVTH